MSENRPHPQTCCSLLRVEPVSKIDTSNSHQNQSQGRSSWDLIWKTKVPPKVWVFGWRVATDSLVTKRNKWRRTLEVDSTCNICGKDEENAYHATVSCPKAIALRHAMRKVWNLHLSPGLVTLDLIGCCIFLDFWMKTWEQKLCFSYGGPGTLGTT